MEANLRAEVQTIAQLEVRKYIDALVQDALPRMVEAGIRAHDHDVDAHGGLQMQSARAKWAARGFIAGLMLMGGAGLERVFSMLF